jgi:hypothetical protein
VSVRFAALEVYVVFRAWCLGAAFAFVASGVWAADAAGKRGPVVVELFTSQGCSACPPADALLAELAARDGIIALAFHVDYWNYLGWVDPFATAASTRRQREYAAAFDARAVYTPQMVINGSEALVGSRRVEVMEAVSLALAAPMPLEVSITLDAEGLIATVVASEGFAGSARILFVAYEPPTRVAIARGENAGGSFTFHNAVRTVLPLGTMSGGARSWRTPGAEGAGGVAILAQATDDGRILGAAAYDFEALSPALSAASSVATIPVSGSALP